MSQFAFGRFAQNRSENDAQRIFKQRIDDAVVIFNKHKSTFEERNCPFCGGSKNIALQNFHDTYGVSRCGMCTSVFVNPAPSLEALKDYYNNSACNILLHSVYTARDATQSDYAKDHRVRTVVDYIRECKGDDPVRILEIGCGTGVFLSKLRHTIDAVFGDRCVELYGIDIDGNAIARNTDETIRLVHSSVEEFASKETESYDAILHFELIEHLVDPVAFMTDCHRLLKSDGLMVFTTPNAEGLEMVASGYNGYRLLAHAIFPPMHLNAFSTENIVHFALRNHFAVVSIDTPGTLDVDMVSICTNSDPDGEEIFKAVAKFDDETKGILQTLISRCKSSSHMRCVFRKI